jgi:Mg2+-importing ATPase
MNTVSNQTVYWHQPLVDLFNQLDTSPSGLNTAEATRRLKIVGPNSVRQRTSLTRLNLFVRQFKEPLMLILLFAVIVSVLAGEWLDAAVVMAVIIGSAALTFVQEYNAANAVEKLLARVQVKASVLRDGHPVSIPMDAVVPGDVAVLSAGNLIPGDGILLQAKDCYVNQAVLTGETFPVEKKPGPVAERSPMAERSNSLFMGTSLRSGTATMLVVHTGKNTAFGEIAGRLSLRAPETDFERGIRNFGYLLVQVVMILVVFVFAINVLSAKPPVDSLLFAIALAVGIAPELLPAVITITLSRGAQRMADQGVIVRRLNAIENFGVMDVLCTDKTGTLTEGTIQLNGALDLQGQPTEVVLTAAYLNAQFQAGLSNPLDEAILAAGKLQHLDISTYTKLDEIPYDFVRKRLSVAVRDPKGEYRLITKGALDNVLAVCDSVADNNGVAPLDSRRNESIHQQFAAWSAQGFRVLGLAAKSVPDQSSFARADEQGMTFQGFLLFYDPPKSDIKETLAGLTRLGVKLKIITGDNRQVAQYIAGQVGLPVTGVLSGAELNDRSDEALLHLVDRTDLFVEVDPNQKERIIRALQRAGHVVGYMGDGINDAPALHVADVGISVDRAVDVAKEAADFVLLEHSLRVLQDGIVNGRRTFANTIKYVFTTTSANFGNMFSMAGISLVLPYLPMLAKQILLNNFLSDIPGMAIAGDDVDQDWIERPHRWDVKFIRNFMIIFGLVSSVFDYLTFGILLVVFEAIPLQFRTAWFVESLMTELVIALVVRTRRPFFRSKPGRWLLGTTLGVALVTLLIPYLPPLDSLFGFTPLPVPILLSLLVITSLYVIAAEIAKQVFYKRFSPSARPR